MITRIKKTFEYIKLFTVSLFILEFIVVLSTIAAIAALIFAIAGTIYIFNQIKRLVKYEKSLTINNQLKELHK